MKTNHTIEANNLSKKYRLGTIGISSLREDISTWWNSRKVCETDSVTKNKVFWALNELEFNIEKGEIIGIIGANGSGKSTLLKILSKITEPTNGQVNIRGKVASLLEVGTGFHPELTGRENVYVNGAILGMSRKEVSQRFDEIVGFSGVEEFIDTPIKRYSSGMTVRLGFAVAAHLNPDILIVDEVLAVGDASFQKKCIGRMGEVGDQGRTVLFVSHNMLSIEALCTKAIFLKNGRMVEFGKTSSVVTKYLEDISPTNNQGLSKRTDRKGSGEIRLTRISTLDGKMKEVSYFQTGHSGNLKIEFKHFSKLQGKLELGIAIDDARGHRIATIGTALLGIYLNQNNCNNITFHFQKVSLLPGTYNLTTFLGSDGKPCDWVLHAFSLKVMEGDFYGFGILPPNSQGDILLDYDISIISN